MKIALDTQVSPFVAIELEACGHQVLLCSESEQDKNFFMRAEEFGAELYVSADYDWMNYALDNKKEFLFLPQSFKGWRVTEAILRAARKIKARGYEYNGKRTKE